LSIRDILNIIDFINKNSKPSRFITHPLDVCNVFKNAIELVIIDGLCLGIDFGGEAEKVKDITGLFLILSPCNLNEFWKRNRYCR